MRCETSGSFDDLFVFLVSLFSVDLGKIKSLKRLKPCALEPGKFPRDHKEPRLQLANTRELNCKIIIQLFTWDASNKSNI